MSYGKACAACTKAKVRCAFGSDQAEGACERCTRLKKDCQPAPRARVSRIKTRADKQSALEAKVDGLVELLKQRQSISEPGQSSQPSSSFVSPSSAQQRCGPAIVATPLYQLSVQAGNQERVPVPATTPYRVHSSQNDQQTVNSRSVGSDFCNLAKDAEQYLHHGAQQSARRSNSPTPLHAPGAGVRVQGAFGQMTMAAKAALQDDEAMSAADLGKPSCSYPTPSPSIADLPPETPEELQGVLDLYRNTMFGFSPIVVIGADVTVEQMQKERPYLWLVLRMIGSKKLLRQLALAEEVNQMIAQKLLIEGERSFDMLCALVVHTNWGQFSCVKANLSPPLSLALGLAGDLGLTKPAPQTSPAVMMNWTRAGCPKPPHALQIRERTMEERRVVLGLFYVSSICANFFQRGEPMRFTPYLEESLNLLATKKDQPTDELLALIIRLQILANSMSSEAWNEAYPLSSSNNVKVPRMHMMKLQKLQLDDLKRTIPAHLQDDPILRYHLLGAEVFLYEVFLQPPTSVISPLEQTRHIQGLWDCFATVKAYFDKFFDTTFVGLENFLYMSIAVYTHLGHCLVALFRLSTFEHESIPWDRKYIIEQIDLGEVVKQWIRVFEASPLEAGIDISGYGPNGEPQWDYSKKVLLNTILKWWETKVRPSIMGTAPPSASQQQPPQHTATAEQAPFQEAIATTTTTQPPPFIKDPKRNFPGFPILPPVEDQCMDTGPDLWGAPEFDFNMETDMWMRDLFSNGFQFQTY